MAGRNEARRWLFASAEFDEGRWTLTVDGRPVAIESKPLELLRELLIHAGTVLSKEDLLDAVWPGVSVVEASLPTAMLKLRRALGDDAADNRIIDTVPRRGYRLSAPVRLADPAETPPSPATPPVAPEPVVPRRRGRAVAILLVALAIVAAAAVALFRPSAPPKSLLMSEASDALRKLDIERIEELVHQGWNPNWSFDDQGNAALHWLPVVCEWDKGHDRERILLAARTLLDAGARVDTHNVWGDTPYTIAKSPRYCGPDHPLTRMIRAQCYNRFGRPGDKCLKMPTALSSGGPVK